MITLSKNMQRGRIIIVYFVLTPCACALIIRWYRVTIISFMHGQDVAKNMQNFCTTLGQGVSVGYDTTSRAYKRREGMQLLYEQSSNVGGWMCTIVHEMLKIDISIFSTSCKCTHSSGHVWTRSASYVYWYTPLTTCCSTIALWWLQNLACLCWIVAMGIEVLL